MAPVVRNAETEETPVSTMQALYPVFSKMALRCRSAIGARRARETAPPPALVILELLPGANGEPPEVLHEAAMSNKVDWAGVVETLPQGARIIISGGDPLLSPQLEAVLLAAGRRGFEVKVDTAGTYLEELAPVVYGLGAAAVKVILRGPEGVHNKAYSSAYAFEATVRGAIALKGLASASPDFSLVVEIPISVQNVDSLCETVECALAMGADKVSLRHMRPEAQAKDGAGHSANSGGGNGNGSVRLDVEALADEAVQIARRWPDGRVRFYPHIEGPALAKYYSGDCAGLRRRRCLVPWTSITIGCDGAARLCDAAIIGAVEGGEGDIYNCAAARNARRRLRKSPSTECAWCQRRFVDEGRLR